MVKITIFDGFGVKITFIDGLREDYPYLFIFFFHVLLPFENKDSEVFTRLSLYSMYICELLLIMNYIYICKQLL